MRQFRFAVYYFKQLKPMQTDFPTLKLNSIVSTLKKPCKFYCSHALLYWWMCLSGLTCPFGDISHKKKKNALRRDFYDQEKSIVSKISFKVFNIKYKFSSSKPSNFLEIFKCPSPPPFSYILPLWPKFLPCLLPPAWKGWVRLVKVVWCKYVCSPELFVC